MCVSVYIYITLNDFLGLIRAALCVYSETIAVL